MRFFSYIVWEREETCGSLGDEIWPGILFRQTRIRKEILKCSAGKSGFIFDLDGKFSFKLHHFLSETLGGKFYRK